MISTTRQVARTLNDLPVEGFLLVVDEDGNEYVADNIVKHKIHNDDNDWTYALKIKKSNSGCLKW